MALVLGLSVIDMSQNAVANPRLDRHRSPSRVYIGDTIYAESICIDKRESSKRPYAGIITMRTRGLNQNGDEVVSWKRTVMVPKKDSASARLLPEDDWPHGDARRPVRFNDGAIHVYRASSAPQVPRHTPTGLRTSGWSAALGIQGPGAETGVRADVVEVHEQAFPVAIRHLPR